VGNGADPEVVFVEVRAGRGRAGTLRASPSHRELNPARLATIPPPSTRIVRSTIRACTTSPTNRPAAVGRPEQLGSR